MDEPNKPILTKEPSAELCRLDEARRIIEEYANDLREFIRKTRKRLH